MDTIARGNVEITQVVELPTKGRARDYVFPEDEPRARASRHRVLGEAADWGALLLPAHFPGPGAAEVRRVGDRFAVKEWRHGDEGVPRLPRGA
ncbi:hypothetical protein AB0N06_10825 [Streptomyces sp. NPDC051020]|uniref:hypothetical protein n=1 Tax=Streptomyces sp. NPDC051020 TaxID=3155409 RepID=UPI003434E0F2